MNGDVNFGRKKCSKTNIMTFYFGKMIHNMEKYGRKTNKMSRKRLHLKWYTYILTLVNFMGGTDYEICCDG